MKKTIPREAPARIGRGKNSKRSPQTGATRQHAPRGTAIPTTQQLLVRQLTRMPTMFKNCGTRIIFGCRRTLPHTTVRPHQPALQQHRPTYQKIFCLAQLCVLVFQIPSSTSTSQTLRVPRKKAASGSATEIFVAKKLQAASASCGSARIDHRTARPHRHNHPYHITNACAPIQTNAHPLQKLRDPNHS